MPESRTAFFAYPSKDHEVALTIGEALARVAVGTRSFELSGWEENDIAGRFMRAPIVEKIDDAICLFADVSTLNFNVTYEIGYAIGRGKRVVLVRHGAIKPSDLVQRIGIFDTLGYSTYVNAGELVAILNATTDFSPIALGRERNKRQPVYVLETPHKTESMLQILSRVKKEQLFYRSFNPDEQTRLSGPDALSEVSASFGVVVPLLAPDFDQAEIHNIRAAFLAGLGHGMGKPTLIISPRENALVPLDVRDLVKSYAFPRDIREIVAAFQKDVLRAMQDDTGETENLGTGLAVLSLGSSIAENEFQHLAEYFIKTDEYQRTLRGETDIVAGRKGAGKTALFAQARNSLRSKRTNIVVDLKPEGFQLLKLKDEVLAFLGEGAKAHLLVAFWEYLLLLEVARKILEKDSLVHLRDHNLYEPYLKLRASFDADYDVNEGDFSERLTALGDRLGLRYVETLGRGRREKITTGEITRLIYHDQLHRLKKELVDYLRLKDDVWVLIDNLDKGWSTNGVSREDILIIRSLIDAGKKLQRDFKKHDQEFRCIVFIRDDVYRFLLSETPDHGKEDRLLLDWRDPAQLKLLVARRLRPGTSVGINAFEGLWAEICVESIEGRPTFEYLLGHSLMRPRYLLNCINHCKAYAVNLGHDRIEPDDIEKGLKAYSDDLVVDTDLELVDVFPKGKNTLYELVGIRSRIRKQEFYSAVSSSLPVIEEADEMLIVLLWQGVFGVLDLEGKPFFIYDVGYNIARLKVIARRTEEADLPSMIVHPAFYRGLDIVSD